MKILCRTLLVVFLAGVLSSCASRKPAATPDIVDVNPAPTEQPIPQPTVVEQMPEESPVVSTPTEEPEAVVPDKTPELRKNEQQADTAGIYTVSQLEKPARIVGEKLNPRKANGIMVFLRSSVVASAVEAQIFEVSSGEPVYIGDINNNSRLHHELTPGKHTFMVLAGSADYLIVNVKAGFTYYAVVKPRMGVWKPKFRFLPVKHRSASHNLSAEESLFFEEDEIENLLSAMTPIMYSKEYQHKKVDVEEALNSHQQAWKAWNNQAPQQIQAKTIGLNDGQKIK